MKSKKSDVKESKPVEAGLLSKYQIICSVCFKEWRDKRRDAIIEAQIAKNPDFLKTYVCRKCKKAQRMKAVQTAKVETSDGEKVEDVEIEVDMTQYIPKESEKYVNRYFSGVKDEDIIKFHYESKNPLMKNVLFIGETGTGKTISLLHFCHKYQIPYRRVVMNGGTRPEDILGNWVMTSSGKLSFNYQVLIHFMRYGGIFVFDEINAGDKEILHILNSIADWERKAIITQHKGEVIVGNPKFLLVATMNPPHEYDLKELSKSLQDRFVPYYFDYDEKVDAKIIKDKKLLEFAKAIRDARNKPTPAVETPLSTRALLQFQEIEKAFGRKLAKEILFNKFQNGERKAVQTDFEVIMEKSDILDEKQPEKKEGDTQ
jgi:hypothetical protein